ARLHVDVAVADDDRAREVNPAELPLGLQQQSRERLATGARPRFVRADIDGVEMRPLSAQLLAQTLVDRFEIALAHETERDSALVGDQTDPDARVVEAPYRTAGAWEQAQLIRRRDVRAGIGLDVDGAVAIQEHPPRRRTES